MLNNLHKVIWILLFLMPTNMDVSFQEKNYSKCIPYQQKENNLDTLVFL